MTKLQRAVTQATQIGFIAGRYNGGVRFTDDQTQIRAVTNLKDEQTAYEVGRTIRWFTEEVVEVRTFQVKVDDTWVVEITYK